MARGTTRRGFIVALASAAVMPMAVSAASDGSWFEDLRPDMYYKLLDGRPDCFAMASTRGLMVGRLLYLLRYLGGRRICLSGRIAKLSDGGYYLSVSPKQYFRDTPDSHRICLTDRWLREFYRRHKDDALSDVRVGIL